MLGLRWSQGVGLGTSAPGKNGCSWRCECTASHLQKGSLGLSPSNITPGHRTDYSRGVLKELFLGQKIKFAGWLVAESHRQSATVYSVPNVLLILSWAAKLLSVNNLLYVAVVEPPACLSYFGWLTIPFPGCCSPSSPWPSFRHQVAGHLRLTSFALQDFFRTCQNLARVRDLASARDPSNLQH